MLKGAFRRPASPQRHPRCTGWRHREASGLF